MTFLGFGRPYAYPRESAMHGALEMKTPWGWLVVQPPVTSYGQKQRWFVYLRDATPPSAVWGFGPGFARMM